MNNNKNKLFVIISAFVFVFLVGGVSYSYFVYETNLVEADLRTGNIKMDFTNSSNSLSLTNQSPMSDVLGKVASDYLDFTVTGKTDYESIRYEIEIVSSGDSTLEDNYIKLYLSNQSDDAIVGPVFVSDLEAAKANNGKKIYSYFIEAENDGELSEFSHDYRLRVWVDDSYNDLSAKEYSFSVYMYAENVDSSFGRSILRKCGTVDYLKSYEDTIVSENPTFTTMDTVNGTGTKDVCYYTGSNAASNSNVLFGGYCWQIVRTTDNGGVRLIYNGVAQNNQCKTDRSETTSQGILAVRDTPTMAGNYLYGTSFDYDMTTGKFSITNPDSGLSSWTLGTQDNFIGKYTCFDELGENCDYVWHIGHVSDQDNQKTSSTKYSIGNVSGYQSMGSSTFSSGVYSLSFVGYMYNKLYYNLNQTQIDNVESGSIFGKNVEYSNGTYLVIEDTSGQASTNTTQDENHHYTCGIAGTSSCATVRYYYITDNYIELSGGETIETALKNMINYKQSGDNNDASINVKSSSIKNYLETWYDKNLKSYERYIDTNTVYCNDRSIKVVNDEPVFGGWKKDGGLLTNTVSRLTFKKGNSLDLSCDNATDRFSKVNNKATLKNPIGLITEPERGLMGASYAATGFDYWGMSPVDFYDENPRVNQVDTSGSSKTTGIYSSVVADVRGVITLKPETEISGGDGSYEHPYVIE